MGLRNGILIRIRKKHIRIGNKFDCVEGVSRGTLFNYFAVTTDCSPTQVTTAAKATKFASTNQLDGRKSNSFVLELTNLILIAFITANSSLEPLIEGLCAQIHVNLN